MKVIGETPTSRKVPRSYETNIKRLFFALWPDQTLRAQCDEVLRQIGAQGKPVKPDNLHVTLAFLGSVDARRQTAILQAAANIPVKPMQLSFNGLSYWKKPAIICLTAQHVDPLVLNLATQLADAARNCGIVMDGPAYQPHVTLLRKAKSPVRVAFQPIIWQADRFCLVESCSTEAGVEYRVLQVLPSQPSDATPSK